jgi:hypothetical protein
LLSCCKSPLSIDPEIQGFTPLTRGWVITRQIVLDLDATDDPIHGNPYRRSAWLQPITKPITISGAIDAARSAACVSACILQADPGSLFNAV